ncbi:hypothetical protein D3C78_1875880 [compost metagenome]
MQIEELRNAGLDFVKGKRFAAVVARAGVKGFKQPIDLRCLVFVGCVLTHLRFIGGSFFAGQLFAQHCVSRAERIAGE